jgi:hypothetical protein
VFGRFGSSLGRFQTSAVAVRVTPEKGAARTGRCNWSICGSAPSLGCEALAGFVGREPFFIGVESYWDERVTSGNHGCSLICETRKSHPKTPSVDSRSSAPFTDAPVLTNPSARQTPPSRTPSDDAGLFGSEALPQLQSAVVDLSWLLSRGYASTSSLKIVGDRYPLREPDPDKVLRAADQIVATADSAILDECGRWVNLARLANERRISSKNVVDLS